MQEGQRVRGMDVGVLAALGRSRVLVRPRPRVVTFSAGEHLAEPGQTMGEAAVRESNSFSLSSMAREAGAESTRAGVIPVDAEVIKDKFQTYLPQADVFVTSGGLTGARSGPRRPPTASARSTSGRSRAVRTSAIGYGTIQKRPLFALPENPVAAVLAFELMVRPALLKMGGRRTLHAARGRRGASRTPTSSAPGRETYLRVRAWRDDSGWRARLAGRQGPGWSRRWPGPTRWPSFRRTRVPSNRATRSG